MPQDIGPKSLKMNRGDIATRDRGTLRAVRWKDRRDVYVLTNMHVGYQTSCCRRLQRTHGVCGQVRQNGQQLWNCPQNMEVDQKLFFHLTDMTILNAFLIHKLCGGKMTHKKFREILVRELIIHSQEQNLTASGNSRGRPSATASQLSQFEVEHSQHWPARGTRCRCHVCSL